MTIDYKTLYEAEVDTCNKLMEVNKELIKELDEKEKDIIALENQVMDLLSQVESLENEVTEQGIIMMRLD